MSRLRSKDRPTVSTRPIGPNQIEVHTHCRHGGYRIGYQLGEVLTARAAVTAAIGYHAMMVDRCRCMTALWPRYKTEAAPADLAAMVGRFSSLWGEVEAQQLQRGYAVLDWAVAYERVMGGAA